MASENSNRDDNRNVVVLLLANDGSGDILQARIEPSTYRLLVNSTITGTITVDNLGTTVKYGQKTVAVTNTAVAFVASATTIKNGVIIQALAGNTGNVVIGDSSVTTSNGFQLQPGQATSLAIDDLASVYVNGSAGDGICYISSV